MDVEHCVDIPHTDPATPPAWDITDLHCLVCLSKGQPYYKNNEQRSRKKRKKEKKRRREKKRGKNKGGGMPKQTLQDIKLFSGVASHGGIQTNTT